MSNVLFDRNTLLVTGFDRDKMPFELEIKNVNLEGYGKFIEESVFVEKFDEDGNELFILTKEKKNVVTTTEYEETFDKFDSNGKENAPCMISVYELQPVLDNEGNPLTYTPSKQVITEKTVDGFGNPCEPLTYTVKDENGELKEVQAKNENGKLLYLGYFPDGEPIVCKKQVEVMKQKEVDGKKVYLKEVTTIVSEETIMIEEEITRDHELFNIFLPRALEEKKVSKYISFKENYNKFTYEDIVSLKSTQLKLGFLRNSILFERMDNYDKLFNLENSFNYHLSMDYFVLEPAGVIETQLLLLPDKKEIVGILTESEEGLKVLVSDGKKEFKEPMMNGESWFPEKTSTVKVRFVNETDKNIKVDSFTILY